MLEAGGINQQPARWVEAMHLIDGVYTRLRRKRIRKAEAERKLRGA